MAWTDERVELLTKLWTDGLSASQVAKQLGGVTRNAVIGKVHRLGLSGRAKPSQPARRKAKRAPAKLRPAVLPKIARPKRAVPTAPSIPVGAKPLPSGEFATILTITEHMCKWPIGDPATSSFRFCGRGTEKTDPYCKAHAGLAYQPARKRGVARPALSSVQRRALR